MVDMFSLKDRYKPSISKKPKSTTTTTNITTSFDYMLLPKKIIKATQSYSAQQEQEISFEKGDFFHVVGRENDRHWYAVNNPLSNLNGLVPVSYFQDVDKSTRTMNAIQPILPLDQHYGNELGTTIKQSSIQHQRCYGIVLYDFVAERQDELECKADETIIVIAQSNEEWYVAKPIGRLGGPGLIPVSFVQLYDIITNHPVLLPLTATGQQQSLSISPRISPSFIIPKLNEWKKQSQMYEKSSIPLSTITTTAIDSSSSSFQHTKNILNMKYDRHSGGELSLSSNSSSLSDHHWNLPSSQRQDRHHQSISSSSSSSSSSSPPLSPSTILLQQQQQRHSYESSTSSLRNSNDMTRKNNQHSNLRYSQQVSLPSSRRSSIYNPSTRQDTKVIDITANSFIMEGDQYWFVLYATVNNGKHRIIYRTYECFYQFHIRLLQEYPMEAGKGEKGRILPLMPEPLANIDDHITEQRREDLDDYCKKLLALPSYLSGSELVQMDLFGLKKGDVETDYALKKGSRVIKSNNINSYSKQATAQQYQQQNEIKINNVIGMDGTQFGGMVGQVKIKIIYKDDIFAVKISADCTMQELRQLIKDRLGGSNLGTMKYKNDSHHRKETYLPLDTEMDMEEAFILAIQHGKLTIAVDS